MQTGKKTKIDIDRDGCIECGNCAAICGDVFELKVGDKADIKQAYRTGDLAKGEVPENLSKCAQDAADACPVQVIHTEQ